MMRARRFFVVVLGALLLRTNHGTLMAGETARAAETEPHYGWQVVPKDATSAIDEAVNVRLQAAVAEVNARLDRASLRCSDVARAVTDPLWATAGWYFVGLTRSWKLNVSPASATEYFEDFLPVSTYRHARLWPFGKFVPVDPAVRVGDVVFGTDKLGHLFTNGGREYHRYLAARAAGADAVSAERTALMVGVDEEHSILGMWASGIFSFADLEANASGLRFYRSLCEGEAPGLRFDGARWVLVPFTIAAWVTPCFDEAFEPSAYADGDRSALQADILALCPRWRRRDVQDRWHAMKTRGCTDNVTWRALRQELAASGVVPDPRPFSIELLCAVP
jgi:hypothetical protein